MKSLTEQNPVADDPVNLSDEAQRGAFIEQYVGNHPDVTTDDVRVVLGRAAAWAGPSASATELTAAVEREFSLF
ncbi:hypothetical protein OKA04_19335 [Luteolibacter flavescens]|uniref:Uncharacterized protein n=1 Tax=Luteolibacter flavescens TaxID=1859460 RepID=A0ABT3FTK9_9BACT|nr:hypothetical protein [Luteolibacter flavescens]MCW1886902.1 hypothetical protein [Luteolibacter flavescens]